MTGRGINRASQKARSRKVLLSDRFERDRLNKDPGKIDRRTFIAQAGAALAGATLSPAVDWAQSPPDIKLEIASLELEIAPGKRLQTVAYNGRVPGPLIRWPEGKPVVIDVLNRTSGPDRRLRSGNLPHVA